MHNSLRESIVRRLSSWPVQGIHDPGRLRAAVALPLVHAGFGADLPGFAHHTSWSEAPALLLTRRPAHMRRNAGQWALPGGRIETGETPEDAVLRELKEEVGLDPDRTELLGRLDDYPTRSGFVITPLVIWCGAALALCPDPEEVASVHRIELSEFLREDAPLLDPPHDPGGPAVLRMPLADNDWIAAPTAAIIYQFREVVLLGRFTRVAHFDQPRFTWT